MTKSMQKLAMAFIAACAVLGGIGAANAQMHGGSHAGGDGPHGGGGSHAGNGVHHGGGFHHDGRFHGRAPTIIFAPGYYPYGYVYPYGYDSGSIYWYCGDPAGYYPDVQVCASGWMQVVPNS